MLIEENLSKKHPIIKKYEELVDFGKYQGKSILFILENDIDYAVWMSNNCKNVRIGKLLLKDYFNNKHPEQKELYFYKFK